MAFERPIIDWSERDARALPPAGAAEWMSPDAVLANAAKVENGSPGGMEWFADPRMPVRINYRNPTRVLLNGYTGEILGHGAVSLRQFFETVTLLHVNLLMKRPGQQVVNVANVCFVFLIVTGFYLWWPRQWRWKVLRNSIAVRLTARGKARDWNWHNALGFWFLPPLLVMAASGLVLSFSSVNLWWRSFATSHVVAAAQRPTPPVVPSSTAKSAPDWNALLRAVPLTMGC